MTANAHVVRVDYEIFCELMLHTDGCLIRICNVCILHWTHIRRTCGEQRRIRRSWQSDARRCAIHNTAGIIEPFNRVVLAIKEQSVVVNVVEDRFVISSPTTANNRLSFSFYIVSKSESRAEVV